jgi:PilZ domain
MTLEHERRRYKRYRLRLGVNLHRGEVQVAAEVFNLSVGGCLLVTPVRLTPGETALVDIPALGLPPVRLEVVRSRQMVFWFVAAVRFEPLLPDESVLARLASEDQGPLPEPEQIL